MDSLRAEMPTLHRPQHITTRAVLVGIAIGTVIAFANTYFGLQTGWISMMSLQAALLGFGVFKAAGPLIQRMNGREFTPAENVLIQTVAGATGTMPLAAGFVGVIPAFGLLEPSKDHAEPITLNYWQLCIWAFGISLFGVFFAVPLRKQVIIKEKLKFPSGSATAEMIQVLHNAEKRGSTINGSGNSNGNGQNLPGLPHLSLSRTMTTDPSKIRDDAWQLKIQVLFGAFVISFLTSIMSHFLPILTSLPIFGWNAKNNWEWSFDVSWAYVGQGIIMGLPTTLSMLLGCIVGWGILSPLAHYQRWAPGPVGDWQTGSKGWILWVSLGVMIVDAIVSLGMQAFKDLRKAVKKRRTVAYTLLRTSQDSDERDDIDSRMDIGERDGEANPEQEQEQDAPPDQLVSPRATIIGLLVSMGLAIAAVHIVFDDVPVYSSIIAVILAVLLSILGVRALGETDLNPVSGIGKISQAIFAGITPGLIVPNLVSGAIAEAGAMSAGEMMQDLKCGHIIGASPLAQFYGQLIGSVISAFVSAGAYKLFTSIYTIPSETFQIPTAYVWLNTSRLVNGKSLPPYSITYTLGFAIVFAIISGLKASGASYAPYLPSGIAFSIGIYNTPNFTLSRVVGGIIEYTWRKYVDRSAEEYEDEDEDEGLVGSIKDYIRRLRNGGHIMVVVMASGFVLGEGVGSIVNMCMRASGIGPK